MTLDKCGYKTLKTDSMSYMGKCPFSVICSVTHNFRTFALFIQLFLAKVAIHAEISHYEEIFFVDNMFPKGFHTLTGVAQRCVEREHRRVDTNVPLLKMGFKQQDTDSNPSTNG